MRVKYTQLIIFSIRQLAYIAIAYKVYGPVRCDAYYSTRRKRNYNDGKH